MSPSVLVVLVHTAWRLVNVPNRRKLGSVCPSDVRLHETMEALGRESFESRAEFLGRSLDEELVGSMNGPRGEETSRQLDRIARTRGVGVSELVAALRVTRRDNHVDLSRMVFSSRFDSKPSPPARIFDVDECPVCTDTEHFGALECGHIVCRVCYEELCARSHSRDACPCPQCRTTSRRLWDFTELKNVEHVVG